MANYNVPDVIHTDKPWSYGAAIRALPRLHAVEHIQVISTARCNNLTLQSHRPTRQQERGQISFKILNGRRNSWPCMPASQTYSSIRAPPFALTSEDRIRTVLTWHGGMQLTWSSELQTTTETLLGPSLVNLPEPFPLSYRDVQELLHVRGIQVSHKTLREWCVKFGSLCADKLRQREPRRGSR